MPVSSPIRRQLRSQYIPLRNPPNRPGDGPFGHCSRKGQGFFDAFGPFSNRNRPWLHPYNRTMLRDLRPLFGYMRRYRWGYLWGTLSCIATNAAAVQFPRVLGWAIEKLQTHQADRRAIHSSLRGTWSKNDLGRAGGSGHTSREVPKRAGGSHAEVARSARATVGDPSTFPSVRTGTSGSASFQSELCSRSFRNLFWHCFAADSN